MPPRPLTPHASPQSAILSLGGSTPWVLMPFWPWAALVPRQGRSPPWCPPHRCRWAPSDLPCRWLCFLRRVPSAPPAQLGLFSRVTGSLVMSMVLSLSREGLRDMRTGGTLPCCCSARSLPQPERSQEGGWCLHGVAAPPWLGGHQPWGRPSGASLLLRGSLTLGPVV